MQTDDPDVIAEVRAVLDRYESALMANDVAVLNEIFWADPRTVRLTMAGDQVGHDAIRAFRASVRQYPRRVQKRVLVTVFGRDFAVTNLFYERIETGSIGRETKIMARLAAGWRVVSAHVSLADQQDPDLRLRDS